MPISKVSKVYASYQTQPKGWPRCDRCRMFQSPAACSLVKGLISSTGWCRFFSQHKSADRLPIVPDKSVPDEAA
jgi:hypothetical protein